MSIRKVLMAVAIFMCAASLRGQNLPSEMEFVNGVASSGSLTAGAELTGGPLHLAQDAEQRAKLYLDAAGLSQVGRFRMKGSFRFTQSYEKGVQFASTFNPLRPMPYVIADSTGGDWKKQDYLMGVDISMPLAADRLALGLRLGLEAGRGAKNTDPRPQAGICDISVMPSISFNAGSAGLFSGAFGYGLYRETSNLILYDSSQPQKLYLLKGLGQYTSEVFSNSERERKYEGHSLSGKMAWSKSSGPLLYRIDVSYLNSTERVYDIDNSKPHDRGRYFTHEYCTKAALAVNQSRWGGEAVLGWRGYYGSGREIVQHFESSSDVNAWVTDSENPARYLLSDLVLSLDLKAWLKDGGDRRSWYFAMLSERRDMAQQYKATSSFHNEDFLYLSPQLGRNIYMSNGILDLSMDGIILKRLESVISYAGREKDDDTISKNLIYHDFTLPLSCCGLSASAGYTRQLKEGRAVSLRGDASCVGGGGLLRWMAGLSIGYSF